ncbi:uncharacterized protein LOC108097368 [Drosophila ficusphila]|uniref:uncharacterized protein LOC108097368 n=1 Tax=Drosophila ficusphila TaxID=30025 RepID=UPI0007E724A5|nr:uncharacterized protein LOC108097368 [Drosophila ficusphila]
MFEVHAISSQFRRAVGRIFRVDHDYAQFSIWNLCPMSLWGQAKSALHSCGLCRREWFPLVFWLVAPLSLAGALFTCHELSRLWACPSAKLTTWRRRHFFVLDYWLLRRARLVGSSLNAVAWLMLVYGIATISPSAMAPWILVTSLVLSAEGLLWSFEVITGRLPVHPQTLLALLLHAFFLGSVCCVQSVFEAALAEHVEHSLRII